MMIKQQYLSRTQLKLHVCLDTLVLSGPGHPIGHGLYFRSLQGLLCFYMIVWSKKQENIPSFQFSHFTKKIPRNLIRLKLVIVNTTNFRFMLGLLGVTNINRDTKMLSQYFYFIFILTKQGEKCVLTQIMPFIEPHRNERLAAFCYDAFHSYEAL